MNSNIIHQTRRNRLSDHIHAAKLYETIHNWNKFTQCG